MAAGEMVALAASVNDIDTSDQLVVFEAYQKVFVVNGANLKVADFVNTKLTCSALTDPPAHGDILTQDQGGDDYAYMVVDFVNTAKTAVYGYAYYGGSATAFNASDSITSNNATATMDASFTPSAVTAGPHWYDWTVYPDIVLSIAKYGQAIGETKTFGSMPNKAYLGCRYRGRCVISGDPEHPNQWYMSRQTNPWDFQYIANDAGAPIAGDDGDAGEAGDIIKTLIPYKDDYLIIGCVNNIDIISGNPAEGGPIDSLSETSGTLGFAAYAWDDHENLYMMGTTGLLKIPAGFGPVENLLKESYPDFIDDLAYDLSLHRITMGYDSKRHGIIIAKVTLTDGTNSCWWYDLNSEGLFPETYPEECAPYSMYRYESNDPDDRGLLFGCKDGYMRIHDDDETDDDIDGDTEAISSYVTFGPLELGDGNREGSFNNLTIETAGGNANGTKTDSGNITCKVFVDRSADGVVEKMEANTSFSISGTIQAPGRPRGNMQRRKVRGKYAAVRLEHEQEGETWGLDNIIVNGKQKGGMK